jgi:hypothetical protein
MADVDRAFHAGMAKLVIAKRYGRDLRSHKELVPEEGVKRKSWKDIQT